MRNVLTIAQLTLFDALRRRVVAAAALCGAAFLLVFGTALFFFFNEITDEPMLLRTAKVALLTVAGMYAANFLAVMFAVLLPVDSLSGEIESGVIQTLVSKPVRRADVVLGKWLAYVVLVGTYLAVIAYGVLTVSRLITGFHLTNTVAPLLLILLEVTLLLTVSLAGGARLSTVTNGIVALAFYGVAFVGGWVEQVGELARVASARNVGIVVSLISPTDVMWRKAAHLLQPETLRGLQGTPFTLTRPPSDLMVWWAAAFTVAVLGYGIRQFSRRTL